MVLAQVYLMRVVGLLVCLLVWAMSESSASGSKTFTQTTLVLNKKKGKNVNSRDGISLVMESPFEDGRFEPVNRADVELFDQDKHAFPNGVI